MGAKNSRLGHIEPSFFLISDSICSGKLDEPIIKKVLTGLETFEAIRSSSSCCSSVFSGILNKSETQMIRSKGPFFVLMLVSLVKRDLNRPGFGLINLGHPEVFVLSLSER